MKRNNWTAALVVCLVAAGALLASGPAQAEDMILTAGEYAVIVASDDWEVVSVWIDGDGFFHVDVVASVSAGKSTRGAAITPDG